MNNSFWWLALISRVRVRRPRWFFPLVAVFILGVVIAGLVYAYIVFNAVSERSHAPNVHESSTH